MGIEGTWYNQLGSTLVIDTVSDGVLTGSYETATSDSGCATGSYSVSGTTDVASGGQTLGFSVTWLNADSSCNSTTVWAGRYDAADDDEALTAFWLLTMKTDPSDEWASTLVGEDVFTRDEPDPDRVAPARGSAIRIRSRLSQPPETLEIIEERFGRRPGCEPFAVLGGFARLHADRRRGLAGDRLLVNWDQVRTSSSGCRRRSSGRTSSTIAEVHAARLHAAFQGHCRGYRGPAGDHAKGPASAG